MFSAYPNNKAQSDDSSSNSKDVGISSIYHVRIFVEMFYIHFLMEITRSILIIE